MLDLSKGQPLANRYSLVRRLGGDAEAQTWLASDRLTRTSVALKILPASSEDCLRSEWQIGIRLLHAHIVRMFEFHVDNELAFFSQQFIDGPDLGVLSGSTPARILAPIGQLVSGLGYLHSRGLVHRDVKASNVLLDGAGAVYLSDFGVACRAGETAGGGSPIAQTPQSLQGVPASPADDIFALGTLMYELLSGAPPWSANSMAADIAAAPPPPVSSKSGEPLNAAIVDLVANMLDPQAERRPDADDVGRRLEDAGYAAGVAQLDTRQRRSVRDERVEAVQSVRPSIRDAQPAPQTAAPSSGLSRNAVFAALAVLLAVLVGVVFVLPDTVNRTDGAAEPVAESAGDSAAQRDGEAPARAREDVYVDPAVRERMERDASVRDRDPTAGDDGAFLDNVEDTSGLDDEGRARLNAENALGELLSAFEVLESRGIELWARVEYSRARELYAQGDAAYLKQEFAEAEERYLGALSVLEPTYERIEPAFENAYTAAQAAFEAGDRLEALQQYELAVAITPGHRGAVAGLERAKNLDAVQRLVEQGMDYEEDLDFAAARRSFEQALALDAQWQPAQDGLDRVAIAQTQLEFDLRMSEGFEALAAGDYLGARAAFRVAKKLLPQSPEPADGLLQVEQGLRLDEISTLESEARSLEQDEHWDAVISTYEALLKVDNTLTFAVDGLRHAREMSALHGRLDTYIEEPDKLSSPATMQEATALLVGITTRADVGPRLAGQRDELSRLLKRAATPLTVSLVSDNQTNVVVYKVGRLGSFMRQELELRPGTYVAVGSRAGYRDVRLEFRVAPEIDMQPVVVQCEEPI